MGTMVQGIMRIRDDLNNQDNRATAHPIYVVQEKVRDYRISGDVLYDGDEWLNDQGRPVSTEDYLHADSDENWAHEQGFTHVYYIDRWEFVQPFFTDAAAKRFIKEHRRDMRTLRIYVDSGWNNREWKEIRSFLKGDDRDD